MFGALPPPPTPRFAQNISLENFKCFFFSCEGFTAKLFREPEIQFYQSQRAFISLSEGKGRRLRRASEGRAQN